MEVIVERERERQGKGRREGDEAIQSRQSACIYS